MHETSREGGMARMRPLAAAEIPSGGELRFEPGGAHFMLIGLHAPLTAGSTISMTLRFQHAGDRSVSLQVVAPGTVAD